MVKVDHTNCYWSIRLPRGWQCVFVVTGGAQSAPVHTSTNAGVRIILRDPSNVHHTRPHPVTTNVEVGK